MAEGSNIPEEEEKEEVGCFNEHIDLNISYNDWMTLGCSSPKRLKMYGDEDKPYQNENHPSENGSDVIDPKPQDADYSCVWSLSDELESLIFARVPRSEHWKLCFVNKRCLSLLKSGELYKIRRLIGYKEPSVFMFASGESTWWAFDREFKSRRKLPILPSDNCFASADKESICAGTHLLISGRQIDGLKIWRYELAENKWFAGPSMNFPRCLFGSASCGNFAYVGGGMGATMKSEVYNTAEKYDPDRGKWESLPRMRRRRKFCAGAYMDDRFYVIGGRNEDGELTCGEYFDETRNRWELIPDMLKDDPVRSSHSPPLLAVVNNELYSLESSTNMLKIYLKKKNMWKELGPVPVRADFNRGWGVAFKSLGNELLVIGASSDSDSRNSLAIYTCCPNSDDGELQWKPLESGKNRSSPFILNCSIMIA